jgi:hypothetical protein
MGVSFVTSVQQDDERRAREGTGLGHEAAVPPQELRASASAGFAGTGSRGSRDHGQRVAARVDFTKGETTRYRSVLHRPDGVAVEFEGGSYNKVGGRPGAVPHDVAHLVVEDELALTGGVWGVLVAGGLFRHARVISGRQAPHAAARGRAIIDAAGDRITQAEILTRAVCDVVRGDLPAHRAALRSAIGDRWWTDALTADALDRCRTRLRAAAADWAALPTRGTLTGRWDHPIDPALAAVRRGGR